MTKRTLTSSGDVTDYTWSDYNRLLKVEKTANGQTSTLQENEYDAGGIRESKTDKNGQTSLELTAGFVTQFSEAEAGSTGVPTISYIQGPGGYLGAEVDGNLQVFLMDGQGSVRDVLDGNGTVIKSFEFDEWGNQLSSSGSGTVPPKTFWGSLSVNDDTADSGLHLAGHRHFDSSLGRFINRDPIGLAGGANLYSLSEQNPVNFVDPSGLKDVSFSGVGLAGFRQILVSGVCSCPDSAESARPTVATVSRSAPLNRPDTASFNVKSLPLSARGLTDPTTGQTVMIDPIHPNYQSYPEIEVFLYDFNLSVQVHGCECLDGCGKVVGKGRVKNVGAINLGPPPTPFTDDEIIFS